MNPQRRSFTASFLGLPELVWSVEVTARCPGCGREVALGPLSGGGTAVSCPVCGYQVERRTACPDDVFLAALVRAVEDAERHAPTKRAGCVPVRGRG